MKKAMYKLVSAIIAVSMLLSMASFNVFADTTDEGLIFDLDLTGSPAEGIQVSNSVAGNSTTYYLGAAPSTGTINGRPYLAFRQSKDDSAAAGKYIKVMDDGLKNNDEMTFEFWARPTCMNSDQNGVVGYRMSSMATGGGSSDQSKFEIFCNGANMYYRPGGATATTNYEMHSKLYNMNLNGKWTHFVFTRKWNPTSADDATVGKWTGSVYVNGTQITPAGGVGKEVETTRTSEDGAYFILGNEHYLSKAFLGDIADVKIYNTILTDAQISSKHANSADDYVAFEIEAVSADTTIDVNAGEVTVDFSENVDASTVSGITLTKADGSAIKGAYIVSAADDIVTVEYGKLEEGASYKLTIPSTVKSATGKNIAAAEYTFTAAKKYIVNEDFTGETTVPTISNITYMSNSITGDTSAMSIKHTSDGDYYLAVKPASTDAAGKNYKVSYTLPNALDTTADIDDMHIVEVIIGSELTLKDGQTVSGNVARDFFNINDYQLKLGEIHNANMFFYKDRNADTGKNDGNHTMKDSNGFAHIRLAFGTHELADGTKLLGYEMVDVLGDYTTTFKPSATYASGKAATAFPNKVSSLLLSHIYTQASDKCDAENRYSDIKVYTQKRTKVLKAEEYNADTKSVTLALNNDLASGEEANIVVTDTAGTTVSAAPVYNSADRTVTITFTDELNGAYNISLANATDADGFACSESKVTFTAVGAPSVEASYFDGEMNPLTTLNGATGVSVTATLSNWAGAAPVAILAVYDNDMLAGVQNAEVIDAAGTSVTYFAQITGLTPLSEATSDVKLFIWEGFDNLIPVIIPDEPVGGGV